ncbi:glycine-rich cell wall structural protein-like [Rhododendron vialii]|uniref:glycine-rich cell wall structural protein-like n=1 Tax=Rhododendron vialii TaxID=182163 RepID=UPI00265F9D03|nr:glycine-rich cell wall structural protein-like [Rhododendron vialii]
MVAEGCLLVAMCAGCRSKGSWIWRSLAVQVLESLLADGGCVGRHHGGSGGGDWGTWWLLGQQQGGGSDGSATRGQRCNGARRQQCNGGNEGGFSGGRSHVMAAWWQYFSGARQRQQVDWHGGGLLCRFGAATGAGSPGSDSGDGASSLFGGCFGCIWQIGKPLEHFLGAVDEVSAKGIASIAQKLISSPLTMASHGDVINVPSYDTVSNKFCL